MKQFLFYTSEGITLSPKNVLCENFQILGFEFGKTKIEAFEYFLMNNPWVIEDGFSIETITTIQVDTQ